MRSRIRTAHVSFNLWMRRCAAVALLTIAGVTVPSLGVGLRSSQAQTPKAEPPDYSNVNDILKGETHLVRTDDLVIHARGSQTSSFLPAFAADSKFGPSDPTAVTKAQNLTISVTGRFFDTDRDVIVHLPVAADGKFQDLQVVIADNAKNLSLLTRQELPFGFFILIEPVVGDFNGDGYDDLGLVDVIAKNMHILSAVDVKKPQSGFSVGPQYDFPDLFYDNVDPDKGAWFVAGDFNGDGREEFASAFPTKYGGRVAVTTYSVNPQTLAVTEAGLAIIKHWDDTTSIYANVVAGRFASADHDQLVVAAESRRFGDLPHLLRFFDFDAESLQPREVSSWNSGALLTKCGRLAMKAGRLDRASPYDQIVFMYVGCDLSGTQMSLLSVDPFTKAIKKEASFPTASYSGQPANLYPEVQDVVIGNFDHLRTSRLDPSKKERDFNLQVALLSRVADRNAPITNRLAITVFDVTRDSQKVFRTSSNSNAFSDYYVRNPIDTQSLKLWAADLQGRSTRLGPPTKVTINNTAQPTVVTAMPPMHADYVTPAGEMQPSVLNLSVVPDSFRAGYATEQSRTEQTTTVHGGSWSFGLKEELGGTVRFGPPDLEDAGNNLTVKSSTEAAQEFKGEREKEDGSFNKTTYEISVKTGYSDQLWYSESRMIIWVYPIIGQMACPAAKPKCQESEKLPLTVQFSAQDNVHPVTVAASNVEWYQPPWEPGNIFSYPANFEQLKLIVPNIDKLSTDLSWFTDSSDLEQKTTWSRGKDTATSTATESNFSFHNESSITGKHEELALGGSAHFKFEIGGSFGFSDLTKNVTQFESSTGISVSKPGTFPSPSSYAYAVTPYIFGEKKPSTVTDSVSLTGDVVTFGALRTAFVADPLRSNAGKWWLGTYQTPDVALNHPLRWQVTSEGSGKSCVEVGNALKNCVELAEKNLENIWLSDFYAMRGLFITGEESPGKGPQREVANAGDKLRLQARVYNYSFKAMTSDTRVRARFYGMPWNTENNTPAGESFLIGEDVLPPIPPFDDAPGAPLNWVLANATFDTTKYGNKHLVFWVVVWMQDRNGLVGEMPGHGLELLPGELKEIGDVKIEAYSNNVGLYRAPFFVFPNAPRAGAVAGAPGLKLDSVKTTVRQVKHEESVEVAAMLETGDQEIGGLTVYFYDGDPQDGGRVFDVERISHIRANGKHQARTRFKSDDCGLYRIFVRATAGRHLEVNGHTEPVQVGCPPAACNSLACLRAPQYYALNLDRLPQGTVQVSGNGLNAQVSTGDRARMQLLLQGGNTAQQQFNQQFVALQLNFLSVPGFTGALKSPLSCYRINFEPAWLDNGVTLSPELTLGEVFELARRVARAGSTGDRRRLGNLLHWLNGDDPTGRCSR